MRKAEPLAPTAERIKLLIDKLCGGSQRTLATTAGCSQAAISKILMGKQAPGKRILEMIAGIPSVNAAWLFDGVGSPLVEPKPVAPRFEASVPIVTALVPGRLNNFRSYRSSGAIYVSETVASESTYAVAASFCDPAFHCPTEAMLGGDYLLIESDANTWKLNLGTLHDRLVAIKRFTDGGETVELHRLHCKRDARKKQSQLLSTSTTKMFFCNQDENTAHPSASRPLDIDYSGDFVEEQEFSVADIVGVVKQLIRLF